MVATSTFAQTNNYFGTSGTLNGSVWSTNSAGPYTSTLVTTGGVIINFGNATSSITGASITVAGINATANATITTAGGTIGNQGNGVIPINVSSGVTLDFSTQSFTSSATAGYIKNGDGVLALSGGTYGGGFTLNAGTVIMRGVNALGGGASNSLTVNGGTLASDGTLTLTGKYSNGIVISGDFTLGATTGLARSDANLTFSNNVSLGSATRTITLGGTGNYTFGGVFSSSSGAGLTIAATADGTLTLSGTAANTYSGTTTINGGTVILSKTAGVNAIAGSVTIGDGTGSDVLQLGASNQIADTSVVSLVGTVSGSTGVMRLAGFNETIGGLSGGGVVEFSNTGAGSSTLTVNVASGTQTYSGTLRNTAGSSTGTLAIEKSGAGTQVLTGTNTYSGTTTVSAGVLQVGSAGVGQTGTGTVTVQSGGTLAGTGTVRGTSFTLDSGGTLHAGDGTAGTNQGTLSFTPAASGGTTSLQGSIILDVSTPTATSSTFGGNTIGSAGYNAWLDGVSGSGGHDRLVFNNAVGGGSYTLNFLTTTGTLEVRGQSFTPASGQVFNLLDWGTLVSANFSGFSFTSGLVTGGGDEGTDLDLPTLTGGLLWDTTRLTISGNVSIVPEPSRVVLLLVGGLGLLLTRRRPSPQCL